MIEVCCVLSSDSDCWWCVLFLPPISEFHLVLFVCELISYEVVLTNSEIGLRQEFYNEYYRVLKSPASCSN